MNKKLSILSVLGICFGLTANAADQVSSTILPKVYSVEHSGIGYPKPEKLTIDNMESYELLPDPFAWSDGSGRSEDFADWEKRRNEIKSEIEYYEIGEKPEVDLDDVTVTLDKNVMTVKVKVGENVGTLTATLNIPEGDGPFPVCIGMNYPFSSNLFPGCITTSFSHDQVAKYGSDSKRYADDMFNVLYPHLLNSGNYSKWSWGISRLIDGLQKLSESGQLNVDMKHIAVGGCSYAGKMAMFAGALDERIALTIAQEPGGGGASAWRTIDFIAKKLKKSVEGIGNTNYSWFMQSLQSFNGKQDLLPHDHHEILAMVAPRALLVLGNTDMEWLGDFSTYITCRAAEKVYETFGIEDRFGFVIDAGHGHCQASDLQNQAISAFVSKFILEKEDAPSTLYREALSGSNYAQLDTINYERWTEGWKPANPNKPKARIVSPTESLEYAADVAPKSVEFVIEVEDINNDVKTVDIYVNNMKLKTLTAAPYKYELTGLDVAGVYNVYAIATDAEGLSSRSNVRTVTIKTPIVAIQKAPSAPIIDGEIDAIWNDEKNLKLYANNILSGTPSDENCSGYVQLMWDELYIYALAVITDDVLINDGPSIYEDDNVELYFDANNSKGGSYDKDDVQYSFRYNDGKNVGTIPTGYSVEGIEYALVESDNGYITEIRIPWTTIGADVKSDMSIGFEFMINDDDDGNARDNKRSWNAISDNAWQSASSFGTITIVGEVDESKKAAGTAINESETSGLSVYPNPVAEELFVAGIEGEFEYQIINVTGKVIAVGKSSNSINVATLAKGIYTIIISNDDKSQSLRFIKK